MVSIDRASLMVAIQAIEIAIEQYEQILDSKILQQKNETDEFLYSLENTKSKLRESYLKEKVKDPQLINYEQLIGQIG